MKVTLKGDTFNIKPLSHEVQFITDLEPTQWEWDITPLKLGNQSVQVSVTVRIEIPNQLEPLVKDYPVYEEEVYVKINFSDLFQKNIAIIFIGIIIAIFVFKTYKNNRILFKLKKVFNNKKLTSKLVLIKLGYGSFEKGFPSVSVQIKSENNFFPLSLNGKLCKNTIITELYEECLEKYQDSFIIPTRKLKNKNSTTNFSGQDSIQLAKELSQQINTWLYEESFRRIQQKLRTQIKPTEPVNIIIESDDINIQKLPWHLWDFFEDYRQAEVALSLPSYDKIEKNKLKRKQIRILSILGGDENINLEEDRKTFDNIACEVKFLIKPTRQTLTEELWDKKGWDIFCFSGHSSSKIDGDDGWIYISDTEKITIAELKYALSAAIQNGLQIAIFNSCDSLGLANQLAALHIPEIIVMREPVADAVAQEFLKNFLTAFAGGKSFYLAVREAREKLQGLEDIYPCASWLPVICQNPAEIPPTWESLRGI